MKTTDLGNNWDIHVWRAFHPHYQGSEETSHMHYDEKQREKRLLREVGRGEEEGRRRKVVV